MYNLLILWYIFSYGTIMREIFASLCRETLRIILIAARSSQDCMLTLSALRIATSFCFVNTILKGA